MGAIVGTALFGEQTGNNSTAVTVNKTFTAGNSLVWFWACEATSANRTVTVSGGGNSYVEASTGGLPLSDALPWQLRAGYALNIAGGSVTVSAAIGGGSAAFKALCVIEFSGHATSGAFDAASGELQLTTGTARDAGSLTNTAAGTLISLGMDYQIVSTPTNGAGFTSAGTGWNFGGGTPAARAEFQTFASGGAGRSSTYTMNTNADSFCGQIFLLDAGGAVTIYTRRPLDSPIFTSRIIS